MSQRYSIGQRVSVIVPFINVRSIPLGTAGTIAVDDGEYYGVKFDDVYLNDDGSSHNLWYCRGYQITAYAPTFIDRIVNKLFWWA